MANTLVFLCILLVCCLCVNKIKGTNSSRDLTDELGITKDLKKSNTKVEDKPAAKTLPYVLKRKQLDSSDFDEDTNFHQSYELLTTSNNGLFNIDSNADDTPVENLADEAQHVQHLLNAKNAIVEKNSGFYVYPLKGEHEELKPSCTHTSVATKIGNGNLLNFVLPLGFLSFLLVPVLAMVTRLMSALPIQIPNLLGNIITKNFGGNCGSSSQMSAQSAVYLL